MMVCFAANRQPDFMIKGIWRYELFGQELWITTTQLSMWVVSAILIILAICARRRMAAPAQVPGIFQNLLEYGVETLERMVRGIMGEKGGDFVNYIGTLFLFILLGSLTGLVGLRPPTADFGVTFLLGAVTFGIVQYQGIKNRRGRHFTSLFAPTPILFPINLIGELANPVSISLRLFANLLSGVIILGLWYGMMPFYVSIGIPAALHAYCDLFSGCIQTYVFCMLSMVYINDKLS